MNSSESKTGRPAKRLRLASQRKGSTYFVVLSVAMIASAISIGALAIQTAQRRQSGLEHDYLTAGINCQSGIDFGLSEIQQFQTWRTKFPNNTDPDNPVFIGKGQGKMAWAITDPLDSQLDDNPADVVELTGIGIHGGSTRSFSLLGIPDERALDVLRTSLHASGDITVSGELVTGRGPVSCDGQLNVGLGVIYGPTEMSTIDVSNNAQATQLLSAPSKQMPSPLLFDIYSSMASHVDFAMLPTTNMIKNQTVGGSENPASGGVANPNGIYLIQVPPSTTLTIENSDIMGTLLIELLGDNSKLVFSTSVNWKPHFNQFPSMIVKANSDVGTNIEIRNVGAVASVGGTGVGGTGGTGPGSSGPGGGTAGAVGGATPGAIGGATGTGSGSSSIEIAGADAEPSGPSTEPIELLPGRLHGLFHVIRDTPTKNSPTTLVADKPTKACFVIDGDVDVEGPCHLIADPSMLSKPIVGYTSARDQGQLITNGNMNHGLRMWQPTMTDDAHATAELHLPAPGSYLEIVNRSSAAAGVAQDITRWLRSGETYVLKLDVLGNFSDSFKMVVEFETDSGLQKIVKTHALTSGVNNVALDFNPVWSGELHQARIVLCTSNSSDKFSINMVSIDDPRPNPTADLRFFTTTWRLNEVN